MPRPTARLAAPLVALLVGLLPLAARAPLARAAATFVVNATGDRGDQTPGDGSCFTGVRIVHDGGGIEPECTLRAAIQEANATAVADTIRFGIPGPGLKSIKPATRLPSISAPVTIDGYSQPGTSPNTLAAGTDAVLRIELDGTDVGTPASPTGDGLTIAASHVVVRGLVINRCILAGIGVFGAPRTGVRVVGNFLGTDASGAVALGNAYGVFVSSADTVVGGAAPADRNLISGNGDGVAFTRAAPGGVVQGNLIGTDRSGTAPLGDTRNTRHGISSAANDVTAAGNVIAFNGGDGVEVKEGTGTRLLRNSTFANAGLGIDLVGGTENAAGATANDPKDPDAGPNTLQNKPVLRAATTAGAATTITGRLNSTPNQRFVLRFFANPAGENEGKTFLGQQALTTNANGNLSFTFGPNQRVPLGQTVTATATGPGGNTSEFSPPRTVEAGTIGG
jgi:CSLREA domain-containing protein